AFLRVTALRSGFFLETTGSFDFQKGTVPRHLRRAANDVRRRSGSGAFVVHATNCQNQAVDRRRHHVFSRRTTSKIGTARESVAFLWASANPSSLGGASSPQQKAALVARESQSVLHYVIEMIESTAIA